MTENETNLLCRELDRASNYYEYGAGESTKLAAARSHIQRIVSTESDRDFIEEHLFPDVNVRESFDRGRLEFAAIDIGPTGRWGRPKDNSEKHKWPNYASSISSSQTEWDLILVDGLFRVACVATAFLFCPGAKVMVHDFWRRKRYHSVLRYCDEVESADELVLLKRKGATTDEELKALLQKHEFLPTDKTPWLIIQSKFGIKI